MRRLVVFGAVLVVALVVVAQLRGDDRGSPPGPGDPATLEPLVPATPTRLTEAVALLRRAPEDHTPYVRSAFGDGWIDADGDCQRTRAEVLVRDSLVRPRLSRSTCTVVAGRWHSWYDDVTTTEPLDLQIDHLVPLAEAWDSGAFLWSLARRVAFANDLGDARTLVAVSAAVNDDKQADDPPRYLPSAHVCRYVAAWTAVKLRWDLAADPREHASLTEVAARCPPDTITVEPAP